MIDMRGCKNGHDANHPRRHTGHSVRGGLHSVLNLHRELFNVGEEETGLGSGSDRAFGSRRQGGRDLDRSKHMRDNMALTMCTPQPISTERTRKIFVCGSAHGLSNCVTLIRVVTNAAPSSKRGDLYEWIGKIDINDGIRCLSNAPPFQPYATCAGT